MNAAEAFANMDRDLGAELERNLSKVIPLKKSTVSRYVAPDPDGDNDRLIDWMRRQVTARRKAITDTKKGCKATLASLAAAKKEEKAKFDALMAELAEREAEAKAQAENEVKGHEAFIATCEAAIAAVPAE